jgi:3-oxoacyl-[acyl-carrier-protein] synthase II
MKRVAITGIGAVSPLGNTFEESWEAMMLGISGIDVFPHFEGLKWRSAGMLKGEALEIRLPVKELRRLDRFILFAHAASQMAVADANLGAGELREAGIVMGSSRGGIGMIEEAVRSHATAYLMAGINGHASGVSNACASGATAIGEAFMMVRHGHAAVMLAGGAEAPLTRLCAEAYGRAGALSRSGISRPFDRRRDGFVLAEGAAVLVLEEYGHALRRGARIYAELAGHGSSCDATHPTEPSPEGQKRAILSALHDADIEPGDVALVCAHATSTRTGDAAEASCITDIFGKRGVRVVALKSMSGHMLGASGAFEAAVSTKAIHARHVPPTVNLTDCEFDLDCLAQAATLGHGAVVSNSFGFGGVNAVLVFQAFKGH